MQLCVSFKIASKPFSEKINNACNSYCSISESKIIVYAQIYLIYHLLLKVVTCYVSLQILLFCIQLFFICNILLYHNCIIIYCIITQNSVTRPNSIIWEQILYSLFCTELFLLEIFCFNQTKSIYKREKNTALNYF